jgi:tripartite-type tricarboxylate transporter receptor subunit TctC
LNRLGKIVWAALLGAAITGYAFAQTFPIPSRPIRIVVPFPPGGQTDIHARFIAPKLGEALGVPIVVENKPGASTIIAAQEVARAAPDGHTIFYTSLLTHTQNPHLYSKLPYDALKDFTPIMQFVRAPLALVVANAVPATTLQELIGYAKANPGKVNYASISPGSTSHLYAELLKMQAGIDIVHIPYKGTADAMRDLFSNQVQMLFDGTVTAAANARGGKVRLIAVTGDRRLAAMPDTPTAAEQGVSGLELTGFIGFFGPGAMAGDTVRRLNAELVRIANQPEMLDLVRKGGLEPATNSPEEFTATVRDHHERWGQVIRRIGLVLEIK